MHCIVDVFAFVVLRLGDDSGDINGDDDASTAIVLLVVALHLDATSAALCCPTDVLCVDICCCPCPLVAAAVF